MSNLDAELPKDHSLVQLDAFFVGGKLCARKLPLSEYRAVKSRSRYDHAYTEFADVFVEPGEPFAHTIEYKINIVDYDAPVPQLK